MNNYITVNHIIFRLKTMFGVNIDHRRMDIIEMIGWAISEIGYTMGHMDDTIEMTVTDYKTNRLNSDIIIVKNVVKDDEILYNRKVGFANEANLQKIQNDIISILKNKVCYNVEEVDKNCIEKDCHGKPVTPYDSIMGVGANYDILAKAEYDFLNTYVNLRLKKTSSFWWYLEGNVIKTNLDNGDVLVHCKKMLTDEDGYPMIINSPDYINYILYSVLFNLISSGFRHPTISYEFAFRHKERYVAKARNEYIISSFNPVKFEEQWNKVLNKYK